MKRFFSFITQPPKPDLIGVKMTQTGAGTIKSYLRAPYAIGGDAAELAMVESKAQDGEYQCRLCPYG